MRLFLLMLYFLFLESCTTVEVGKEIVKASNSIKTTISEIIPNKEDESKIIEEKNIEDESESKIEAEIEAEKETITIEQKEQKNIVATQQKVSQINLLVRNEIGYKNLLYLSSISHTKSNNFIGITIDEISKYV